MAGAKTKDSLGHYSQVYNYTPAHDWNGSDSFQFTFTSQGETSSIVNVGITVNAVNDAPTVATPIPDVNVRQDAADTVFTLYSNFADAESAASQLIYSVTSNTNPGLFTSVNVTDPAHFRLDYAPGATGTADITVRATDTGGLWVEDTFRVTVTATPPNQAPVAGNFVASLNQDSIVKLAGWNFTDADGDSAQSIQITKLPDHGTLFKDVNNNNILDTGEAVSLNQVITWADAFTNQSVKYKGGATYSGPDSVKYVVTDTVGATGTEQGIASITVINTVNDAPGSGGPRRFRLRRQGFR